MWTKTPEKCFNNSHSTLLKHYLQVFGYFTDSKTKMQLPCVDQGSCSSTTEDEVGTETESETEEKIQPTSLIEKFRDEIFHTTQLIFSFESGKIVSRLREPQQPYAMSQSLGIQNQALWPSELQVKIDYIKHCQYPPAHPEPFYEQTGEEDTPMIRGDLPNSQVVYEYDANSTSFFITSCRAVKNESKCCINKDALNSNTLLFESRFESGNLAKAVQVGEYDYELYVHCDLYTQKHTQWYYFQVSNTRKGIPYRFTIVNFLKNDSLYNYGMKPLMYSEKAASDPLQREGWQRTGNQIKYYKNDLRYEDEEDQHFYSLTWTFEFTNDQDTVYFAHCYPYTYTDLQIYLIQCNSDPYMSKFYNKRILCKTLAGNNIYILTITNPGKNRKNGRPKKAIVVTARVHPGESNASWIMKGFLDFITSDSSNAEILRDNFVFKIVPMINPDGVIVGNYRCSLSGCDLNRNYDSSMKESFPPVWNIRNMIKKLLAKREILLYCDLHGHSRKQNMFMYGCCESSKIKGQNKFLLERVFPLLLSKSVPDQFHFDSCKFQILKGKERTGRVIIWNMGISNSFTLEASFCGSTLGNKNGTHFNTSDYELMGQHFCLALLHYCNPDPIKFIKLTNEVKDHLKTCILTKCQQKGICIDNITVTKEMLVSESSDSDSDSSDLNEPPVGMALQCIPKKKKKLTKKQRDKSLKLKKDQLILSTDRAHVGKVHMAQKSKPSEKKTEKKPLKRQKTRHKKYKGSGHSTDKANRPGKVHNPNKNFTEKQQHIQPYYSTTMKVKRSLESLKRNYREFSRELALMRDFSHIRESPSNSSFDDDEFKEILNKDYDLGISKAGTKPLLAVYLNNIGISKERKKEIPETSSDLNIPQQTECFFQSLIDSSDHLKEAKKSISNLLNSKIQPTVNQTKAGIKD